MPKTENFGASRDACIDNIRAFLMICVVLCHLLELVPDKPWAANALYYTIYIFHMPLFVYLSGMLSTNYEKCAKEAITRFLIPYLILNWLFCFLDEKIFSFFTPHHVLWFLLSMFFWKMSLLSFSRLKFAVFFAFTIALSAGTGSIFGYPLSLSRTAVFLPFFIMGALYGNVHKAILAKVHPAFSILLLIALIGSGFFLYDKQYFSTDFLYMAKPYFSFDLSDFRGIELRALVMLLAVFFNAAIIAIALKTKRIGGFTYLGESSLSIYILHGIILIFLKKYKIFPFTLPDFVPSAYGSIFHCICALLLTFVIVLITGNKLVHTVSVLIYNLPKKLLSK